MGSDEREKLVMTRSVALNEKPPSQYKYVDVLGDPIAQYKNFTIKQTE